MTESPFKQRNPEGWQSLPESWPECIRKLLASRGIKQQSDLNFSLEDLPKPEQLLGMDKAVALLAEAVMKQWHILIVADFDTDGATSCAVAIKGLSAMGLHNVAYIVPNRFVHGYGLTPELLQEIPRTQQVDLIITVDNGIASIAGVDAARERGMQVLITDHHLPGEQLPMAQAIVNPNQEGDDFPSKNMAGVGVCFYLLLGLRQALRQQAWFEQQKIAEPKLMDLLDLVAVGTVADLVRLDRLNRTLVNYGLARIRAGKACAGINALIEVAGHDKQRLSTSDIGFAVAPRLNAAGRLEDMSLGIETLLTDDYAQALIQAQQLSDINMQRREVEQDMQADAVAMLEALPLEGREDRLAYCLYDESWHQGVIGLLASRVKERQHRPVIAFAPGNDGEIKGSARSIPGVHIRDVLALVASEAPTVLDKFGGHAMAAGLTIKLSDFEQFEALFESALNKMVDPAALTKELVSDGELADSDINLALAEQLPLLAAWGQGFPEPQFEGTFQLVAVKCVGQQQNHLRLTVQLNDGRELTAMAFGQFQQNWLVAGCYVAMRYRLSVNEFRQQRQLQLIVEDLVEVH